jgi:hypothetical protein
VIVNKVVQDNVQTESTNFLNLFKSPFRKITLVVMYWWMFRFFMYYGLNLALESILHSGLLLTIVIAVSAVFEILGSFGFSNLSPTQR